MMKLFFYIAAPVLAISIFNMINFKRALDKVYGKMPLTLPRLKAILKYGFCRPIKFWLLDWYYGLFNFDFIVKCVGGCRDRIH